MSGPDEDGPPCEPLPVAFEIRSRPYILGGGVTLSVRFSNVAGGAAVVFNMMSNLEEDVLEPGWFARAILRQTFEGRIAAAHASLRLRAHNLMAAKRKDQLLSDVAAAMLKTRAAR